ncbi:MAG: slipin family protein, partial [Rhodococcus sp. (in: high G+C Gram-positive bacteria)]|nr:slipin family protein [Rhodococcus sp. (in: high G+C Gram-positive bacteria)]
MAAWIVLAGVLLVVALFVLSQAVHVVTQYEKGVLFRFGRLIGVKEPGLHLIIPLVDRLTKVSLRIVTMPIQSQGIITRDNVSVDISAVAYFRVIDAVKSVVAIENVAAAIDQIAQTTLRRVVGRHTLDEALSETNVINANIREFLDVSTLEWGVEVTLVELKDIQLPDSMKRAMARQAEAEREKRAKIIAAEGESIAATALGQASDTMMAHPLALQLRNLQTLVELGVEKNTTVVFPAPMMSAITTCTRANDSTSMMRTARTTAFMGAPGPGGRPQPRASGRRRPLVSGPRTSAPQGWPPRIRMRCTISAW